MTGFGWADDETVAGWKWLAGRVREALATAGLSAVVAVGVGEGCAGGGAVVRVDAGDDDLGGVHVYWQAHARLVRVAGEHLLARQLDSQQLRHNGAIDHAMRDAMLAILGSAGFDVRHSINDLAPFDLTVFAAPDDEVGTP